MFGFGFDGGHDSLEFHISNDCQSFVDPSEKNSVVGALLVLDRHVVPPWDCEDVNFANQERGIASDDNDGLHGTTTRPWASTIYPTSRSWVGIPRRSEE